MVRIFLLSVLLTWVSIAAFAQERQIEIRSSELIKGFQASGFTRIIRPVFAQEGSTLAADSADFNQVANTFDAFGHVVITQPSGTTIYSDLLNYDGNTKLAILSNNVRLIDGDVTLTTNNLTYNMNTRIGIYKGGGKIVNGKNVLTSKNGYYFAATRDAYFRNNVVLTTPDALIKNDTLRYNSNSKIAYFYGPTHIYGKDDTLYTENGTYNTTNDQARFGKNNLYTQGSKSLTGDSLFYDRKAGYGKAIGHITFIDTAEKAILKGGLGEYKKSDESILVTKNPYVVIISETDSSKVDSIWMTADTLLSKVVFTRDLIPYKQEEIIPDDQISIKETPEINTQDAIKPVMADEKENRPALRNGPKKPEMDIKADRAESPTEEKIPPIKIPPPDLEKKKEKSVKDTLNKKALSDTVQAVSSKKDTVNTDTTRTRMIMAYHNAKIFKSDLQAKADSMFFSYSDSTVRCYVNPMVWAQGSQLTGDTVYLQMKNKKLDNMLLQHNSFIVNTEDADSTNFNQIKGKVITGYFKDNKLNNMFVDGNAESVYYLKEDSAYSGLNHMISSRLRILLKDNKLSNISAIRTIEASITPMEDLQEEDRVLKGFIWKPRDRPKSKEEIIPQLGKDEQKPAKAKKSDKKSTPAKSTPSKSKPSKTDPSKSTEQKVPVKASAKVVPKPVEKTAPKNIQN
jgi:lipopolysaccharide export system protein LptA